MNLAFKLASKINIPTAPLILAVIVGTNMEQSFRQALTISDGSFEIFFDSTISLVLLGLTLLSIFGNMVKNIIEKKKTTDKKQKVKSI